MLYKISYFHPVYTKERDLRKGWTLSCLLIFQLSSHNCLQFKLCHVVKCAVKYTIRHSAMKNSYIWLQLMFFISLIQSAYECSLFISLNEKWKWKWEKFLVYTWYIFTQATATSGVERREHRRPWGPARVWMPGSSSLAGEAWHGMAFFLYSTSPCAARLLRPERPGPGSRRPGPGPFLGSPSNVGGGLPIQGRWTGAGSGVSNVMATFIHSLGGIWHKM